MNTSEYIYQSWIQDPKIQILDGFIDLYHPGVNFIEIETIPSWEDALYHQQIKAIKTYYPDYFNEHQNEYITSQIIDEEKLYGKGNFWRDLGKGLEGAGKGVVKTVKDMGKNPLNVFNIVSNVAGEATKNVQDAYQKDKEKDLQEHLEKIQKELEPKIKEVEERKRKIYQEEEQINRELEEATNQRLQSESGINEDIVRSKEKQYKNLKIITISTLSVLVLINVIFLIRYATKK